MDKLSQSKIYKAPPKGRSGQYKYYTPAQLVVSRFSEKVFELPRSLSHETCNCVYLLYCTKSHKQYVGQTKNELGVRIYQHAHNIKHKIEKRRYVVQHFLVHELQSLKVTGLQSNSSWAL